MRKLLSALLAFSLALTLSACGAKVDEPAEDKLRIVFADPLTKETEYKADDGTVLLIERYELPRLEVRTAQDETYKQPESVDYAPQEYRAALAFNAEMQRAAEELDASAQEALTMAREHYDGLNAEQRAYWTNYAEELIIDSVYQRDGFTSVWGTGYSNYGGAHGWESMHAWNFDLAAGEFLTFDTLGEEGSDALREKLSEIILDQINEQGLQKGYFEDFDSYIKDLFYAVFYLDADGMTVEFASSIIAPYAAGPQIFEISYDAFSDLLNAHVRVILGVEPAG